MSMPEAAAEPPTPARPAPGPAALDTSAVFPSGKDPQEKDDADTADPASAQGAFSSAKLVAGDASVEREPIPLSRYVEQRLSARLARGRRGSLRPTWMVTAARAWARRAQPQRAALLLISCCDEYLGLEIAAAILDTQDPLVAEPPLSVGNVCSWALERVLGARSVKPPPILNLRRRGSSQSQWLSALEAHRDRVPQADARCILVCEHAGEEARQWYEDALDEASGQIGPLSLLAVDDAALVLECVRSAGVLDACTSPDGSSVEDMLMSQVQERRWAVLGEESQSWKAVLSVARHGPEQFGLQFQQSMPRYASDELDQLHSQARERLRHEDARVAAITVLGLYFGKVSVGPFIDICREVCARLPRTRIRRQRSAAAKPPAPASDTIDDALLERCGLTYQASESGVVVWWSRGIDQQHAVEKAVEASGVIARADLLALLSELAIAADAIQGIRNKYLALLGDVCDIDRGDPQRNAQRLCRMATPPPSLAQASGLLGARLAERWQRIPEMFPEAFKALRERLDDRVTDDSNRPSLLRATVDELWRAGGPARERWQPPFAPRTTVACITRLYRFEEVPRTTDFLPPVDGDDLSAKLAEFFIALFEAPAYGGRAPDVMPSAQALRFAEALALELLAEGRTPHDLGGLRGAFVIALFSRLMTRGLISDSVVADDRTEPETASLLWEPAPTGSSTGATLTAGLSRLVCELAADGSLSDGALLADMPHLEALSLFMNFHWLAGCLTGAAALGAYRNAYLGRALVEAANVQGVRGSLLIGEEWFWHRQLRERELNHEQQERVQQVDDIVDAVIQCRPVLLLWQLLRMAAHHAGQESLDAQVTRLAAACNDDKDQLRAWAQRVGRAETALRNFHAACRSVLSNTRCTEQARRTVTERLARSQREIQDLAILLDRLI